MKKFILKTIYFLLPLLFVFMILEILLRSIPNDYSLKKKYLDKNSSEIEILILGSSHSFYGINPACFSSKTFNASHVSQSLKYDYEILKKYRSELNNLKVVILPISYFSLFATLEDGVEFWRIKNYNIYYGLMTSNTIEDYFEIFSSRFSVSVKKIFKFYALKKTLISCTELGWGKNYLAVNAKDLVKTGKSAAKRHTKGDINSKKNQIILKNNIEIIKNILAFCKSKNAVLLLVTPPAFSSYREHIDYNQLDATIQVAKSICEVSNDCSYLNLLDSSEFASADYYDADHLSEIGAEKLSSILNAKLQNQLN